ncbi:glycosyltransferase family 9 protein [bacterium]|nr:glycosyltransferase family 9 protein [candidate division CSSED10-310 bacterium]
MTSPRPDHWNLILADFTVNVDCRYYIGEKPCKYKRLCAGCSDYSPMGTRILIVKFGAMGDALRTTPILTGLRRTYQPLHITWLTDAISHPLLAGNPYIDQLWIAGAESLARLMSERFDLVLNFDKVPEALASAHLAKAARKLGFRMTEQGTLGIYNEHSRYSWLLGLSDPIKFKLNTLTYQQMIFEMAELSYDRASDFYSLGLGDAHRNKAAALFEQYGIRGGQPVVGLNTGCGPVFATKKWTEAGYIQLAKLLAERFHARILLLGGKAELERNQRIATALGNIAINTGNDHHIKEFAALIERCDLVVTGDTVAMHIAIALRREVVALFGPTCHQEIDLYDRGEFVVTDFPCAPCYLKVSPMNPTCMEALRPETVFAAAARRLVHCGFTSR